MRLRQSRSTWRSTAARRLNAPAKNGLPHPNSSLSYTQSGSTNEPSNAQGLSLIHRVSDTPVAHSVQQMFKEPPHLPIGCVDQAGHHKFAGSAHDHNEMALVFLSPGSGQRECRRKATTIASVTSLSHRTSFLSCERIIPSKLGIKQLV